MRVTKVYTRTGDQGTTRLANGTEVSKDNESVIAYGDIDELNSILGYILTMNLHRDISIKLRDVQDVLFNVGGELSFVGEMQLIHQKDIDQVETWIDTLNNDLKALEEFIIPGGSPESAQLHIARTVTRRGERNILKIEDWQSKHSLLLKYINRLSDLFFVMARYENECKNISEPLWNNPNK